MPTGKPTIEQLKEWYKSQSEVSIEEKNGSVHEGIILGLNTISTDDAVFLIKGSSSGVYLRDITSYYPKVDSVFLEASNTIDAGITLISEGKEFYVNRRVLCEKLEYFRVMFQHKMQ